MGREWLYWVGGGGMGRPRSRRRTVKQDHDQSTSAGSGCMCAVFQLFDLHHHLPLNHQHSLSPFLQHAQDTDDATLKGVEAPRNSLEMMEEEPAAAKQEEDLNCPAVAGIQIKTRREDLSAETSIDSPGTKTPNLVARLMGLDLLPESNSSPSFSCPNSKTPSKSHLNQTKTRKGFYDDDINVGARSLPATPRISSARRSDVDYHHPRLSLQINKDNSDDEFAVSAKTTRPRFRHQQDENRSPRHYAKQILKQVKESVSRRAGHDITNTTRDRERDETIRRDQNLLLKLSKKNSITHDTNQSPKLRILDTNTKNKPPLAETPTKSPRNSASSDANPSDSNPKHQPINTPQHQEINIIGKKLSPKGCDQAIRNKKEDAFVRSPAANKVNLTDKNKSKKAPLSNELLHLSGPTVLPVKKGPSPPATKLPQKQPQVSDALSSKRNTQLSSKTRRSYKQQQQQQPDKIFTVPEYVLPDTTNVCATATTADYRCYIHKILKRAGIIDKLTPLTLGKWHTPSHPLDPSIFYYLELFHPAAAPSAAVLSRRCNRKLIFQLVDEILADVLRPHLDYKPWISPAVWSADHFGLVDDLCRRIKSFPAADCQVLEDIDFLIENDLCKAALNGYYEEEGERLVREIEGEIVEQLVSETVAEGQKRWMSRDERDAINWESSTWTTLTV